MSVCMYVYIHVCTYVCIHICMCVNVYMCDSMRRIVCAITFAFGRDSSEGIALLRGDRGRGCLKCSTDGHTDIVCLQNKPGLDIYSAMDVPEVHNRKDDSSHGRDARHER